MITLSIQYFAILREQRGTTQETLSTDSTTPQELYVELSSKHPFTLPASRVRAAVNGQFVDPTVVLSDGDEIVFIPPVAGG